MPRFESRGIPVASRHAVWTRGAEAAPPDVIAAAVWIAQSDWRGEETCEELSQAPKEREVAYRRCVAPLAHRSRSDEGLRDSEISQTSKTPD